MDLALLRACRSAAARRSYFGGPAALCVKSKQSLMSSAACTRWFNGGMSKICEATFNRLTCECRFFEVYPLFAYGLSTRQPTREPYRNRVPSVHDSTFGGSARSTQPPQSSQVMKITVFGHSPPVTIAFT